VREVVYPHLRREEHVFSVDGGPRYPLADGLLVAVRLCGVDVTIAHLQCPFDGVRTRLWVVVLPRPETQHGHSVDPRRVARCR
jgi:hypothetical protein